MGFQYNICYCSIICSGFEVFNFYLFQYNICYCSIVPSGLIFVFPLIFQYNICYCSIDPSTGTSIKLKAFQYNICYCSIYCFLNSFYNILISIQHLLLFNLIPVVGGYIYIIFQYNICYCSISECRKRVENILGFQYNICYCSMQYPFFSLLC